MEFAKEEFLKFPVIQRRLLDYGNIMTLCDP